MRKFFAVFLLVTILFSSLTTVVDAARFGGGRSFGMQRSVSNFSRPKQVANNVAQSAGPNRWLGPLAGLAAGGLLAYLFMGHGIGTGLMSWLAIFGIGFFIWNFIRNRQQVAMQTPQSNQFRENNVFNSQSHFTTNNAYAPVSKMTAYPADFDAEAFVRDVKVQFIRLQAAFDAKDLNDLREFTSPEVFAEIQLQLNERGNETNHTEVTSLGAEILDVAIEADNTVASVQFAGMVREAVNAPAIAFNETWHFRKNIVKNNWVVVGIQQNIN